MAVSTGIGFDLSAALAQADKLDKYMDKWAKQSESISANMRQAMTAKANNDMQGFTDALSKASSALSQLSGMKLSPDVDSSKVSELANILSGVIDTMTTMSKLPLFDTQGIYNTNKGLGETSATLSGIRDKISGLKKEWEDMEKFSAPVNKKTGKAFGVNTKTYQQAEADYKASIEKRLQEEIEKEAIAKKELDWAKKTQDEKAAYIQKKLNEILKAEQKNVDEVRREYSRLLSDLGKVETRKKQYAEAESAGKEAGIAVSPEVQTQYQEVLRQEQNLVERKKEIETQYWSEVTDIAERFVLQQSQKEIEEFKRRAQEKKKIDDAQFESYLKTSEGAISLSDDAKSINEEKEAIKYLIQARDNLSKSTANYDTIIADLNNRIQKHRISVEELTKAEQNENTLQPKIRNEYAQLLKEMDKIAEAKKRLSETDAYKDGNAESLADMNALDARYNDLAQRRLAIEQNAQGQLDEVVRQHEATRAQESINATIKEEEEKKRIREEYAKKYGAMSSTDAQSVIGGSKATENLRQAEKAVQDLKEARAKLNRGDADYKRTLDALNKEIARQEKNIDRIVNAERRRAEAQRLLQQRQTAQRETYAGALEYSRQAKSITELSNSIKYLDAARKKEDLSTKEGRNNYDKLTAVLEKQQKQYDKLTGKIQKNTASLVDTAGQLKRAFTLIFSLSQIRGYFNQLVQIRGEFEMQHRSLQVLLQDQDKANEIWDKTVALAIKSPFRVKDLVTYTKQLAAYRVESDKLYDTTRMLADVSAGLGVDMNRLILAFGQVKAANFLRGTELRQFSEAGVNMLDELAKKFSEVQGRAVSVGEVFEMVSKRMVSFKDVEEIFQKITSEGGMFYQMQEKQSATLQGMIMNLRDSIDVMLNEIGISSDNTLKKIVSKTKELVDNWRNLMPYVTAAMGAMAGNVTAKSISKIVDLTKEAVKWMKAFHTTRRLATATTPWGLLGTSIGLVTGYIIGLVNKTNEFKAAMNEVENNVRKQLRESIDTYRKLVQTVQDVTKTEKERSTAMSNLKSKYAEILPDMELERDYIEALGTNYDKANQAMFAYYDAKAKAQKKDRIENIYEEDISNRLAKIQSATLKSIQTRGRGGEKMKDIMASYSDAIIANVIEDAKNGLVEIDEIYNEIITRLSKFSGLDETSVRFSLPTTMVDMLDGLQKTLRKRAEALESIPGMIYETYDEQLAADWKNSETEKIHAVMDAYSSLIRVYEQYAKMSDEERSKIIKVDGKEMSQEQAIVADSRKIIGQLPAEMQSYIPLLDDTVKEMIEIARKGSFEFASSTQMMQQAFINSIIPIAEESAKQADGLGAGAAKRMVDNFLEELGKSATRLDMTDFQNSMIKGIQLISDKFKVNIDEFDKFIPKTEEAVSEIRERLNAEITAMSEELEAWKNSLKPDIEMSEEERSKFMLYDPQKMDDIETRLLPAYKELAQLLGANLKKDEESSKKAKESLSTRIKLIEDMYNAYLQANKLLSKPLSIEQVNKAFADTFKDAFEGTGINLTGLVIDKEKLAELQEAGTESGKVFSDAMLSEMNKMADEGTYIRDFVDETIEFIKENEGKPILTAKDVEGFRKGYTLGFGEYDRYKDTGKKIQKGDTITEEEALKRLSEVILPEYKEKLNEVLDANRDLIFTQKQYTALLDLTYQGDKAAATNLIKYAKDEAAGLEHIASIQEKIKNAFGEDEAERFADSFISKFKEAETVYDRIAILLETMNLTVNGGKISETLYKGMQQRSDKRAALFSGELETVKLLQKASIDISEIDFTNIEGVISVLERLVPLAEKDGKEAVLKLKKEISNWKAKIGLSVSEEDKRKLFQEVQEMFDQFDLAKELKGMGFSEGLMNSLFNIEYLDLDELRQKMIDEFSKGAGKQESELLEQLKKGFQDIDWDVVTSILGKDQMEELRKRLEQIGDMVDKQYQEDAKKYLEYARAAIGERAKIKLDELKKIREVEDTFKAREGDSEETLATKANLRQDAIEKIKKESKEAMNKLDWDEFQKSDMFVNLFKDLDNASSALLAHTIKKLHDFKEQWKDMPLEDVRQIVSKLNELEAQLAERSPWKAYAESIEEVRDAMKSVTFESASALSTAQKGGQNNFFAALEQENVFQQEKRDAALEEAHIIETVLRLKQNMATEEDNILATQEEYQSYRKQDIADLETSLAVNQAIADSAQDTLDINQRLLSNRTKQQKALLKQASVLKESQQMASDLYGAFKDLSDVLGGSDSPEAIFADMGASMINTVLSTIQLQIQLRAATVEAGTLAAAINTAMGVVGFIVMGVQLLVQAVSAIISYGDKKKQAQLDALARKIEKLQDEFEGLSDAIDNAWTSDEIQKYKSELDDVHEKMIQAQKDKIALLEDSKNVRKGKTDSEEYKEYEAALKALAEMEKGYVDEMANIISTHTAGIFDDGISAARAFTDAWHDSFLETGDGLAGLEDSFDDMLKNLIRQQATLQITGEFAKKWQKELSKYINEDDLELTKEEAQKWSEEVRRTLPALSEALENYLGSLKFSEGESGLSGLQKGIQGITEDTAEIIAAYLDAIRQYVAMQNEQIDMLVSRLDINGEENPMLSHLKIIVTQTTAIKDLLNSLTRGGHSKGGVGLKVFMD